MASAPRDVGGGTRLLLLSNLPAEITTDDIEKYFYTRVPEVDAVLVKNRREGIATVEVNGLRDPEKFVQQQHRFGRDKIFFIKLIQEVNTIEVTDTIEVTVVNSTDITNDEDIIKLYLEGPSSGGNKEKEVKFIKNVDEGVYRVQLSSIEDSQMIMNKKGSHKFFGTELKICYANPHRTHALSEMSDSQSFSLQLPSSDNAGGNRGPSLLSSPTNVNAGTPLPLASTSIHVASLSADRHNIRDTSSIDKELQPTADKGTSDVSYYADRLSIIDIPSDWNKEALEMEIEDTLNLEENAFSLQSLKMGYNLILSKPCSQQELLHMIEMLLSKDVSAKRCEISRSVLVAKINNEQFHNLAALKLYFGNNKRSGGGEIDTVEELCGGSYIVTFQDHNVIPTVIAFKHRKLGPDVEVRMYEEDIAVSHDNPSDSAEDTLHSQVVVLLVSGISNAKFQDETMLKEYFENTLQSGGGQVDKLEFVGKSMASVSFKDYSVATSVLKINHHILGENVQISIVSEKDEQNVASHQFLSFPVDQLVASYLKEKRPNLVTSALCQLEVTVVIDIERNSIVVTPTSSSPANWYCAGRENLQVLTREKIVRSDLLILKEARADVLSAIMKEIQTKDVKFELGSENNTIALVSEAAIVASLNATINGINAKFVTKEEVIPFDDASSFAFFKGCRTAIVNELFPELKITLNQVTLSLVVFGCIKNLTEFKEKFPEFCKHSLFPVQLQPLELELLRQLPQQDIIQENSEVVPFFKENLSGSFESFFLLSSPQQAVIAENLASSIRDQIKMEARQLPKSFNKGVLESSKFCMLTQELNTSHQFEYEFQEGLLKVAGIGNTASVVSQTLIQFIKEECAVTKVLSIKGGVWRLLNTKMNSKWMECSASVRAKGIEIVKCSKQSSKRPSLTLKGEPHLLDEAEELLKALQALVFQRFFPIERPGIAKFFKDTQNKKVLYGIQAHSGVCIEIGSGEDQYPEVANISSSRFRKVCSGSTRELKTVNVYIGDITTFKRAEVIVNAANEDLNHIGGVALAIAKKGGPVIQGESNNYVSRKGKVETGQAILLGKVGDLPQPYRAIVHAVGPIWNTSSTNHEREIALLKKACIKALSCAMSYESIAIPAISSGIYGFPIDVCADTLVRAVVEFSKSNKSSDISDINFIILKDNVIPFQKAMEKHITTATSYQQSDLRVYPQASSVSAVSEIVAGRQTHTRRRASSSNSSYLRTSRSTALQQIKITCGSILDVQVNALVNTTDPNLGFGGIVSKALLKAAGDTLKDECASKAPVPVGGVAVTGAGNLKCKHIMHVVLPNYDGPGGQSEKVLCSVIRKCLRQCDKLKLSSIAIPSIGAGNLKYPDDVVARCLLDEAGSYLKKNQGKTSLKLIHFVIFDGLVYQAFQQHHRSTSYSSVDTTSSITNEENITSGSQSFHSQSAVKCNSFSLTPNLQLVILQGDISDDDSHVIVNTTNEQLELARAGAVSGAILQKGGSSLQAACDAKGIKQLQPGKVVTTQATGSLKCREVFHIVFNSRDDSQFVQTIFACLQKAEDRKHQSIAFPAIGTGISHYPPTNAAKGTVKAVQKFVSKAPKHVRRIRMVLFQQDVYQEFMEAFVSIKNEAGASGWLQSFVSGVKAGAQAVGSFLAGANSRENHALQEEPILKTSTHVIVEEEEWEDPSCCFDADVSMTKVVIAIFGETKESVQQAEKQILEIVGDQYVRETLQNEEISLLSLHQVKQLEEEAALKNVDIEIDCDPALHTIKLYACRADVLGVKDSIREMLYSLKEANTKLAAAEAIQKHIQWTRQLSDGDDDYDLRLNYVIEEAYSQKKAFFICDEEVEKFTIDFGAMKETDKTTNVTVMVKRVDLAEVEKPADWIAMPIDPQTGKEVYDHLVALTPGTAEYRMVEKQFSSTMIQQTATKAQRSGQFGQVQLQNLMLVGSNNASFSQLVSIERLQNPNLYGQYIARKKQMDKHNPKGTQNERWLYHGTTSDTCEKINTQGFNRSFKGKNGTVYGEGVYFARDTNYSDRYARPDAQGNKKMYLTRVLTGEFTVGNSKTFVPPPKNLQVNQTVLFDSTVDNVTNPAIFVVYFDAQSYPAYLITYQ